MSNPVTLFLLLAVICGHNSPGQSLPETAAYYFFISLALGLRVYEDCKDLPTQ